MMTSLRNFILAAVGLSLTSLVTYLFLTPSIIPQFVIKGIITPTQHYDSEQLLLGVEDYRRICGTRTNCSVNTMHHNNSIEFYIDGNLKCVLCIYNRKLIAHREYNMRKTITIDTNATYRKAIGNNKCKEYYGCDYFGIIEKFSHITTFKVSWKSLTDSNWTEADYPIKYNYKNLPPTKRCRANSTSEECLHHISSQANLTKSYKLIPHETFVPPKGYPKYIFYIHVIRDGMVDHRGSTRSGKLDLLHHQCLVKRFVDIRPKKHVNELFSINEFYGDVHYHAHMDTMLRLTPYLEFLKQNPEIYIHAGIDTVKNDFELLGLSPDRIITGHYTARTIYIPQGNGCGGPQHLHEQILHTKYQDYIAKNVDTGPRNSLVQILRSTRRFLVQQNEVSVMLEKVAHQGNLTFEKFVDNPPPSFIEQVKMFARAKIVVAPHGAGLVNLLFARPDTRIVEILLPDPNPLFSKVARYLGMAHVGLISLGNSDIYLEADVQYVEKLVTSMVRAVQKQT